MGVLMAVALSMHATIHRTNRTSPTQLVFGCNHFLNVNFEADMQAAHDCSEKQVQKCEENSPPIKHWRQRLSAGRPKLKVTHMFDNNTLQLRHETSQGGACWKYLQYVLLLETA
jgi:hypothetical protein